MKIRIRDNSVRFRLTKTEVETFCSEGIYGSKTNFGKSVFNYNLVAKKNIAGLEAEFSENTISLFFPEDETKIWANSVRVGYEHTVTLDNGEELYLLVEKDFVCMDESIEDQSDNYPNPKANL